MVLVCKNFVKEFECFDKVKCVVDEYKCDGLLDCDDVSDELFVLCKFLFLNILVFILKNVKNDLKDLVKCYIVDIYVNK